MAAEVRIMERLIGLPVRMPICVLVPGLIDRTLYRQILYVRPIQGLNNVDPTLRKIHALNEHIADTFIAEKMTPQPKHLIINDVSYARWDDTLPIPPDDYIPRYLLVFVSECFSTYLDDFEELVFQGISLYPCFNGVSIKIRRSEILNFRSCRHGSRIVREGSFIAVEYLREGHAVSLHPVPLSSFGDCASRTTRHASGADRVSFGRDSGISRWDISCLRGSFDIQIDVDDISLSVPTVDSPIYICRESSRYDRRKSARYLRKTIYGLRALARWHDLQHIFDYEYRSFLAEFNPSPDAIMETDEDSEPARIFMRFYLDILEHLHTLDEARLRISKCLQHEATYCTILKRVIPKINHIASILC